MISKSKERGASRNVGKRLLWGVGIALVLLLVARIWTPSLIRNHVNDALNELDGYSGSIDDVSLSLIRGAYQVDGIVLEKDDGEIRTPFLRVSTMDLSLEWLALFRGALVGELILEKPELFIVASDDEASEQIGDEGNWVETVQSLFPFTLNRFEVVDGAVVFGLDAEGPLAKAKASELQLVASNISNVKIEKGEPLPSHLVASAVLAEGAPLYLEGRFDLLSESIEMDMNFQCEHIDLPYLNPLLESYANLDVNSGVLGIFAEWTVLSENVDGYVKFLAREIDVFELGDEGGNPLSALWDAVAGFLITLTENRNRDQFAAKIPFSGNTADLSAGIFPTIGSLFRNAFVKALNNDVDGTINIGDLASEEEEEK